MSPGRPPPPSRDDGARVGPLPLIIVGVGNLGRWLATCSELPRQGCRVIGLFDSDQEKVGERVGPEPIRHVSELQPLGGSFPYAIGVITTPPEAAQEVAVRMVAAGIRSILNFSGVSVRVPADTVVRDCDFSRELIL